MNDLYFEKWPFRLWFVMSPSHFTLYDCTDSRDVLFHDVWLITLMSIPVVFEYRRIEKGRRGRRGRLRPLFLLEWFVFS